MTSGWSRRDALRMGGLTAGGLALGAAGATGIIRAGATATRRSKLTDIEHVVVILQENRSFDHYFGTRKGVRGFSDPNVLRNSDGRPIWYQKSGSTPEGYVLPFHLESEHAKGQCGPDPAHDWLVQHVMWNGGRMDGALQVQTTQAMGYYTRSDLPWYHSIADEFTLCDGYHCSVLSSTNPNRMYTVTGTLDADGRFGGGPANFNGGYWYTWETYPERLERAGVSWRMYHDVDDFDDNMLKYFRQFQGLSHTSPLWQNAIKNRTVEDFIADVDGDELPAVSYVIAPAALSEHPSSPPVAGQEYVRRHVEAIVGNPKVWEKTVIIVSYDENGGFFDHVPPPTPPPGTPDEFVAGVPVGLGFRVPTMVISPWSHGGKVVSETFDHTSILRFLEKRFGVEAHLISKWRRETCGDLMACIDLDHFDPSFPTIASSAAQSKAWTDGCSTKPEVVVPSPQSMPTQEA